ncbi:hypothetical protein CsSME_00048188 [Camellia sinensis var. sinensis]
MGGKQRVVVLETSNGPNGLIRSLSLGDLNRPDITLEVVLDKAHFDGNHLGLENVKANIVEEVNPNKEVEASDSIDDESSPSEEEGGVHQSGDYVWDSREDAQFNENRVLGKIWKRKDHKEISFRNGFQRGALIRAAAMASLSSLSISNVLRKQKRIRQEAEATVQLGKTLRLTMHGKEAEIVERLIQIEIEDIERMKDKGVELGA